MTDGIERGIEDVLAGDAPADAALSEDSIVDGLFEILTEDGDPTVRGNESMIEVEKIEEGADAEGDAGDGADSGDEGSDVDDPDDGEPDDGADESGDKDGAGDEGADGDRGDNAADGLPATPSLKANDRIRKLVDQRRSVEAERDQLRQELEAAKKQALATDAHPDPEAEVKTLKEQYKNVKTPEQIVAERQVNPMTGEPYTAAEAAAAIANLKQDIQFKIAEANDAVVERMGQAREAERLTQKMVEPLSDMIQRYPQLDRDNENADPYLCDTLQSVLDANAHMERGILVGFAKDPAEVIGNFEKMMKGLTTVKVNKQTKVDRAVDKTPTHGALDSRTDRGKMSDADELAELLGDSFKELGFNAL